MLGLSTCRSLTCSQNSDAKRTVILTLVENRWSVLCSSMDWSNLIPEEKDSMRDLILSGGPWSEAQRSAILDYCQQDVIALGPLLDAMLRHAPWSELQFNQAILRGRYMKAVGAMQHRGIPIDLDMFDKLNANWEDIKLNLIENVDAQYGVYVDGRFKEALFQSYLAREEIPWPRLDSGRLALDRNTFSNMSKRYPIVQPLHELRKTLGDLKLNNLAVGRDGRNRTLLSPLAAKTGRNQPSTTKFIFGPAKWIRGLIKPLRDRHWPIVIGLRKKLQSPRRSQTTTSSGRHMRVAIRILHLQSKRV